MPCVSGHIPLPHPPRPLPSPPSSLRPLPRPAPSPPPDPPSPPLSFPLQPPPSSGLRLHEPPPPNSTSSTPEGIRASRIEVRAPWSRSPAGRFVHRETGRVDLFDASSMRRSFSIRRRCWAMRYAPRRRMPDASSMSIVHGAAGRRAEARRRRGGKWARMKAEERRGNEDASRRIQS